MTCVTRFKRRCFKAHTSHCVSSFGPKISGLGRRFLRLLNIQCPFLVIIYLDQKMELIISRQTNSLALSLFDNSYRSCENDHYHREYADSLLCALTISHAHPRSGITTGRCPDMIERSSKLRADAARLPVTKVLLILSKRNVKLAAFFSRRPFHRTSIRCAMEETHSDSPTHIASIWLNHHRLSIIQHGNGHMRKHQ